MHTLIFGPVIDRAGYFVDGAILTLTLTAIGVVFGLALGIMMAIARRSLSPTIVAASTVYVEFIRNTPLLVQLFLTFFGLASIGIHITAFHVALVTVIVNVSAYSAEIIRAGLDAIPKGQIEAAESLGLSRSAIYRKVTLLQALEKVYPSLTSQFVMIMLGTSVVSQISVQELTGVASMVQWQTYRSMETYLLLAGIYIALMLVLRGIFWLVGYVAFARTRVLGRQT